MKRLLSFIITAAMVVTSFGLAAPLTDPASAASKLITGTGTNGAQVSIDWSKRYHFSELENQMKEMNSKFPGYCELSSIGKSWQGRDLMCMTITNEAVSNESKIEVGVFGNIHGSEQESAACAMYSAWYLLENSSDPQVADILNNYIVHVVPVINPDGYEQSFIILTRENANPNIVDPDGDGIPFNDNGEDINDDGMIGKVVAIDMTDPDDPEETGRIGTESKDGNGDGILGNDPVNSTIDLNRNFDHMWGKGEKEGIGPSAGSEPETKAIQNFLKAHKSMEAFVTLHTGSQAVFYPWGYQSAASDPKNAKDIQFMRETAGKMAKACAVGTERNFYANQSYDDYATCSEMIDYAYALSGMHGYTVEVYHFGENIDYKTGELISKYDPSYDPLELGSRSDGRNLCLWNNELPNPIEKNYTHEEAVQLFEKNGIDPSKIQVDISDEFGDDPPNYRPWGADEGIQISYIHKQQTTGKAPVDQDVMVSGIMDGILAMIDSERPALEAKKAAVAKAKKIAAFQASKVKIKKIKSKKRRFTISWYGVSNASVYQVYYAKKGKKTYKWLKSSRNLSLKSKKLKRGKKYKFKVRAYMVIDGQKYYSKFSSVHTKKCKR